MPYLILSFYEDYYKTSFENFNQMLSWKLYYEDKNLMIRVKLMPFKIRTILFILLYDIENSTLLMNLTWNSTIRKKKQ